MRSRLGALLLLIALASPGTGQTGLHTPPRGSAERRQILDAMRAEMRRFDPRPVIFVVRTLRVHGGWAWLEVTPQSPDGREHYEPESALLRRSAGRWSVAERMPAYGEREGTPEESDCGYIRSLRRHFTPAPADIFPPSSGCR
jgi:hypothetical protein